MKTKHLYGLILLVGSCMNFACGGVIAEDQQLAQAIDQAQVPQELLYAAEQVELAADGQLIFTLAKIGVNPDAPRETYNPATGLVNVPDPADPDGRATITYCPFSGHYWCKYPLPAGNE